MAISQVSSRLNIESVSFQRRLKPMQTLSKIQRSNQDRIPSTALVRQSRQSLGPDPLDKFNEVDLVGGLRNAGAELGNALSLERNGGISDNRSLVAATAAREGHGRPHFGASSNRAAVAEARGRLWWREVAIGLRSVHHLAFRRGRRGCLDTLHCGNLRGERY